MLFPEPKILNAACMFCGLFLLIDAGTHCIGAVVNDVAIKWNHPTAVWLHCLLNRDPRSAVLASVTSWYLHYVSIARLLYRAAHSIPIFLSNLLMQ